MKSYRWLLAISFIPFSFFGFLFAQLSNQGIKQPDPVSPTMSIPEIPSQSNILLITVDMGANLNPQLVSVWGMFFSTKGQKAAEIIPLYPSKDSLKDTVLLSEFFLSEGKHLDQKFLDLTKKAFQVEWDAYVVIDQTEILKLSEQLGSEEKTSDSDTPSAKPEILLLKQLCLALKSAKMELDLRHLMNTEVMDSNLSTSTLTYFQQWIDSGQPFSSCEVQQ